MKPTLIQACLCASALLVGCTKPDESGSTDFSNAPPTDLPAIYRPFWTGTISATDEPSLLAKLPYERISLERRAGMANAPNYRVIFHRSGLAELDDKGGPEMGRFISDIDPYSYARLCYLIERSHFDSLRSDYRVAAIDLGMVIVSVTGPSGERTVSESGLVGPIELWTIQQTIEGLKARTQWRPAN